MAKEWTVQCKSWISKDEHPEGCLRWVKYSDRSYRKMLVYGHSRLEYCTFCQKKQTQARANMAVSYFSLKLKPGANISDLKMGPLGMIQHPERPHRSENIMSKINIEFGVTEKDVQNVYDWFKDPAHRVVIIIGGTGSGKSTKFVNWLATPPGSIPEDFFTRYGQIIIGQPRRVAAEGSAGFGGQIAGSGTGQGKEWGVTHGGLTNADWRNLVVQKTHGQILNMIEGGDLKNVGLVMVDEAHERSLEIDSLLRNLKEQLPIHPHLRVVIASATIDAEKFCDYFGRDITTIVEFKAVQKHSYYKPGTKEVDFTEAHTPLPYDDLKRLVRIIPSAAAELTEEVISKIQSGELKKGDILVFMPGKPEVEETMENLSQIKKKFARSGKAKYKILIYPLFRGLSDSETKQAVEGDERLDTIRVIVSTNIAEASVTIKSLVYVVETGLAKVPVWEESLGKTSVPLTLISRANARQRWGRAGRVRDGRVFTLYTKAQYENLMLEYPVPDIQRANLENLVINSRASGLINLKGNWLENPPSAEVERALKVLGSVKALDKDNSLTDYGRLLRRFNYPAHIVDMLLASDIKGCLVEVATLIPMIRNGGIRQILLWDKRWSAQTKYEVYQIHRTLMAGCRDDVEFLLKIFYSWEIDVTDTNTKSGKPRVRSRAEKQAWAKRHFVNHESLLKVAKEREEEILSSFYVHKKDPNFRPIEIGLIDRAKSILAKYMASDIVETQKDSLNRYQFKSRVVSNENSLTTFSSLSSFPEINMFERLMCDQLLPVNCIYEGQVAQIAGDFAVVRLTRQLGSGMQVIEIQSDGGDEKADNDEEENGEQAEIDKAKIAKLLADTKEVEKLAKVTKMGKFTYPIYIRILNPAQYKIGQKIEGLIDDFGIWENLNVFGVIRSVPNANRFKDFGSRIKIGDAVDLKVIQIGKYPEDPEISLVTQEVTSGVIIALDPEDVVFAYAKSALDKIPLGTNLRATILDIDIEKHFIKTSLLPEVEREMNVLFAKNAVGNGKVTTGAKVLEFDPDHNIHLLLDWSQPDKGQLFIASKQVSKWHKSLEETAIGEQYEVSFSFYADWSNNVKFNELPPEVTKIMGDRIAANLKHEDGMLSFSGRMTFGALQELTKVTNNFEFRRALRKLYWKSNQPIVGSVTGNINDLKVGQEFLGTVTGSKDNLGIFVQTPIGSDGLVHVSGIGAIHPSDLPKGSKVNVKVLGLDPIKKKISLSLI